jgi:hypothetical protein
VCLLGVAHPVSMVGWATVAAVVSFCGCAFALEKVSSSQLVQVPLRAGPNRETWPSALTENPYQSHGLDPRFGPTLCDLYCAAGHLVPADAALGYADDGPVPPGEFKLP